MELIQQKNINFEDYWNSIQDTVKNILTFRSISRETWFKCFNDSFILSMDKSCCLRLYESTKFLLEEQVLQILCVVQTKTSENLIEKYYSNWQKYRECVNKLNVLYIFYNKVKTRENRTNQRQSKMLGITYLGLDVWKRNMLLQLKDSLPKSLCDEIDKLRRGISITTSLDTICAVINTFIEVQEYDDFLCKFYTNYFEDLFLNLSKEFIKCEILRLTKEFNLSEYLVRLLSFYEEEIIRSKKLFPEMTYSKVLKIFSQQLEIDKLNLIHGEFETILKEERLKDMRHIYLLLFNANHKLDLLAKVFREHIEKLGKKSIESLKPKYIFKHFIEEVLNLHDKYKSIVEVVFHNHFVFNETFNKAFTVIINNELVENQSFKSPEYLLKYCDTLLKKSFNGIFDAEIQHKLLQSIILFKYMEDINVFQNIYKKQLAQRLLLQQSYSIDIEERMINKLKIAWGNKHIIDLHQMVLDIRASDELNAQFISELDTVIDDLNISFSTNLLQKKAWPLELTATSSFVLPEQLKLCVYHFETFYKKNFEGRKLTWHHHQSQGELKLNYLQKMYIVTMHTIEISILLLFEDCDSWKYSEISNALQLTNEEFEKHINSLLECKLLLLDCGNVTLNMEFENKHSKFHTRSVVKKEKRNDQMNFW